MMAKNIVIITSIIVLVVLGTCWSNVNHKPQTFKQIYPAKFSAVTKIEIRKGNGELKTITDKTVIHNFINSIKDISFIPEKNQEKRVGYLYFVNFYEGEDIVFSFSSSKIDDYYFKSNKPLTKQLNILFEYNKNLK